MKALGIDMNESGFDQHLKKRILRSTALFCLLLTLVNSLGLKLFFSYEVDGNAFYGSFSVLIESAIRFFEIIAVYAGYAAMVWSLFRFGPAETLPFALVNASLLCVSVTLGQDVYQTVVDLTTYGPPVNMTELVYLIRPYAEVLIYFFVGYCVLFAAGALFEHWDERGAAQA